MGQNVGDIDLGHALEQALEPYRIGGLSIIVQFSDRGDGDKPGSVWVLVSGRKGRLDDRDAILYHGHDAQAYLKSEVAHSSTREGRSVLSLPAFRSTLAKYLKDVRGVGR